MDAGARPDLWAAASIRSLIRLSRADSESTLSNPSDSTIF
jgi:hypothetical protein